jgi:hypothetical protein
MDSISVTVAEFESFVNAYYIGFFYPQLVLGIDKMEMDD